MTARATLHGTGFLVELDNYRFLATTHVRQTAADAARAGRESGLASLGTVVDGEAAIILPRPAVAAHSISGAPPTPPVLAPVLSASATPAQSLESGLAFTKRSLGAIQLDSSRPTIPLDDVPGGPQPDRSQPETEEPQQGRRFWPFQLGRRNTQNAQS
jgi:hypothetical protein